MRVMLIDASEVFRIGLRTLLATSRHHVEIVGELERVDLTLIADASPDVLVLDLAAPGANALLLDGGWRDVVPATRLMLSSNQSTRAVSNQVVEAGASGYITKTQRAAEVLAAFDKVADGSLEETAPRLAGRDRRGPSRVPIAHDGLGCLSRREREVFELLVWGASNKEVATELAISVKTVETHRSHINAKIGAHSAADMVRIASFSGMFDRRRREPTPPARSRG